MSRNDSLLCVGLDPEPRDPKQALPLNLLTIEATRDLVCAYKPNLAIYDAMEGGEDVLRRTLEAMPPWIPKIGDAKRSDIGPCGAACMRTLFEKWKFDAATVNPYMGLDAVEPFLDKEDKAALVLCRTSNRSAPDLQDLLVAGGTGQENRPLYLEVAALARTWNQRHGNVGLVVGATYPDEIAQVRQLCPDMLFLIPGVGAQGGDLKAAVQAARDDQGAGFIINVSRQIMRCALSPEGDLLPEQEARKAVRREADQLRAAINLYRRQHRAATAAQPAVSA
jgi:orotidine 5'-phosphate decarboxylase subfamily 2